MIGTTPVPWLDAFPAFLVCLTVLLLPGALALRLAGCRGLVVLGAAGPLTASVLTVGGVVVAAAGAPFTPVTLLVLVGVTWAAAALLRLRRRAAPGDPDPVRTPALVGSLLLAAGLGAGPTMARMGSADAIPQHPDTIFHLGTILTMVRTENISTLDAVGFATPGVSGFYPAAFHGTAAVVSRLSGADVAVAATVTALVASFVVWPAGVAWLAARTFPKDPRVVVLAPLAAVAFTGFPTWLLGYGVLWPNLFGQALLPAALAALLGVTRHASRWRGWVLLAALVPGLGAGHPGAVFGFMVLGGGAVVLHLLVAAARGGPARRRWGAGALAVVAVAVTATPWLVLTGGADSMRRSNPPGPEMTLGQAVGDILLAAPRGLPEVWVTAALVLLGLLVCARRTRTWWVVLGWALVALLYLAVAAVDSPGTRLVTWPWYNNLPRLGSLIVLPMALLLAAALAALAARIPQRVPQRALIVLTVFALASVAANAPQRMTALTPYFPPDDDAKYVSRSERQALAVLREELPQGAVVAANPWNGGAYLGLLADVRMVFPTEKTLARDPDQRRLGAALNRVGTDPQVCRVAARLRVGWAITGGVPASPSRSARTLYRGVDRVGSSESWRAVTTAGPYTLHQRRACADG